MSETQITITTATLGRAIKDGIDAALENYKADLLDRFAVAITSAVEIDRDPEFVEALEVASNMVKGGIIEPVWEGENG
jgi:hypothetical protein